MKGKKGEVIRVDNWSEVKHEEKYKGNKLMKCTGMVVKEELMKTILVIMEKNSKNKRKITYSPDFFFGQLAENTFVHWNDRGRENL